MGNNITYRLAASDDAAFIYQALKDMALEHSMEDRFSLTTENLTDALFSSKAFAEVMLAISNDQHVGLVLYSMTNRNFDLFNGPGIYVHDLYVIKNARRKGIGTQLMKKIKDIAHERNCSRVDWVVLKNNQTAVDFYNKINDAKNVDYIHYVRMKIK